MEGYVLPLAAITFGAAIVNGALGYGFSSLTVPLALLFMTNRVLNPALVLIEVVLNAYVLWNNRDALGNVWRRVMPIVIGLLPGIIVGTTLQPLAESVGMHPVHFAIVGIVSLAFGLITPPYGMCLMISCAVAKVPLRFALKDTMIMLIPMLVVLFLVIIFPDICLFLPRIFSPDMLK